jgi:hypothetical protein
MQLIPRYLVTNRSTVVANDAGFVTEYRPVYTHQVKITKGIDNVVQFRFLNADQKPVDVSAETVKFVAYDEGNIKVLDLTATALATKGLVTVTITKTDLANLPQQFLKYALYIDDGSTQALSYSDSYFGNNGTMFLDAGVFPEPRGDIELPFTAVSSIVIPDPDTTDNINYWASDPVVAAPSGEVFAFENAIIVSPAILSTDLTIQYTTDRQLSSGTKWIDITPTTVSSDSTETHFEFDGTYNYIRVYTTLDPQTISSIVLRN